VIDNDWLAARFEDNRPRLRAIAHRMLGSPVEAEDAVQETWIRLHRSESSAVENLGGWLTTVVARVCLDMLRARSSRRETPADIAVLDPALDRDPIDPEQESMQADSVGLALLIVLETLKPSERLAFVLHDMFGMSFEEIGPILNRSPAAARQLASRARRRVREADTPPTADTVRRREIVSAFLAAAREGDFEALLELLHPGVTVGADTAALMSGAPADVAGPQAVAGTFAGRAKAARPALLAGEPGLVWADGGVPKVAFAFMFDGDLITRIEMIADQARLNELAVELL
jgi:RNA polymerase sigma-70 factor (ECF subfamily)